MVWSALKLVICFIGLYILILVGLNIGLPSFMVRAMLPESLVDARKKVEGLKKEHELACQKLQRNKGHRWNAFERSLMQKPFTSRPTLLFVQPHFELLGTLKEMRQIYADLLQQPKFQTGSAYRSAVDQSIKNIDRGVSVVVIDIKQVCTILRNGQDLKMSKFADSLAKRLDAFAVEPVSPVESNH